MPPEFSADEVQRAISSGTVRQWLGAAGTDTVHLGLFDASGTLREKRLSAGAAATAFEQGWSFIDAIHWWGPDDEVWREGGSQHQPATVDPGSGRPYPFEPRAALFLADFEGPLADLSPRTQLRRLTERAADLGLEADLGWEFECIVLDDEADTFREDLRPAMRTNRCWSAHTMAAEAGVMGGLDRTLAEGAVPLHHVCAELGPGCLELALSHRPAPRSADDAALAKLFTKAYFATRSQTATFMAQLGEGFPGLGGHPSLSFRSALDGSPALSESDGSLSKTGRAAIAGVVALLPELLALATPSPNSYRRFGPGNWAPSTATWGLGNYSCALRVVAGDPSSTRLELRIPGADTSPHHCAAMFLGAAVWGIERGLEPPAPIAAPGDGRDRDTGRPLPRDLVDAAQRFTESDAAHDLFGTPFVEHYAASRLVEVQAGRRFVSAAERRRYLHQA
jgi:glutamine synthetase